MPEPLLTDEAMAGDLRGYFAATTAVTLPEGVTAISSRTLGPTRWRVRGPVAGVAAAVAVAAALFVLLVTRLSPQPGTGGVAGSLQAGGAGAPQAAVSAPGGAMAYPGIDAAALAAEGIQLSLPARSGGVTVSAAQAQAVAVGAVGDSGASRGPAVLAQAVLARPRHLGCLCWAVAVTPAVAGAGTQPHVTDLVLIDADSGRVVATLPVTLR